MGDVINLNKQRKARARVEAEAKAAANRVKFGRTKAQKTKDDAARRKADRAIDQAKRED